MTIEIICIGKLKESYWRDAIAEYSKRISRFCSLKITELAEVKLSDNASKSEEEQVIEKESRNIIERINPSSDSYVIALDVNGKELSSPAFSERLEKLSVEGKSRIVFIIGGSLGLSEKLLGLCDFRLSFSPMTFPHQMMRVILLEQVYRAFKIWHKEKYHK